MTGGDSGSTARRALIWVLITVGVALLLFLAWQLRQVLILVFLALLVAAAAHQPIAWLEGRGAPRPLALAGVYLGLLAVFAAILWIIVPPLVGQVAQLAEDAPQYVERAREWVQDLTAQLPGDAGQQGLQEVTAQLSGVLPSIGALAAIPLLLVNVLVNFVLILVLSALLVLQSDALRDGFLAYVRPERRGRVREVAGAAIEKLGAYVRGQLVMMVAIGMGTAIGMLLIGVPFVLPLSFLAFLAEAIPLVGPFIAGVPIVIIAFVDGGLVSGLLMAGWIIGLQQLEGYVLQPMIQRKALELSPVIVMLSVLAGGTLGGVIGALIAIPLVAVVKVVLSQVVLPLRRESWGEAEGHAPAG